MAQKKIDHGTQVFKNIREVVDGNADDAESRLQNSVITVKVATDFGVIDSAKVYYIDGVIDMNGVTVEIPSGGISLIIPPG